MVCAASTAWRSPPTSIDGQIDRCSSPVNRRIGMHSPVGARLRLLDQSLQLCMHAPHVVAIARERRYRDEPLQEASADGAAGCRRLIARRSNGAGRCCHRLERQGRRDRRRGQAGDATRQPGAGDRPDGGLRSRERHHQALPRQSGRHSRRRLAPRSRPPSRRPTAPRSRSSCRRSRRPSTPPTRRRWQ